MILTYRYRVKDKHSRTLNRMARDVNFVWNYCNDFQKHCLKWNKRWPTTMSITYQLAGASKLLSIPSNTINAAAQRYVQARQKNPYLRYRGRKSLGWVPIKGADIKEIDGTFRFFGKRYSVWLSRNIPENARVVDGSSFSQDAQGRWYLNVCLDIPDASVRGTRRMIGLDLGLKDLATLSDGTKVHTPKYFSTSQEKLSAAQRANKRKRAQKIHAKIANQRKDFLHKVSSNIVASNDIIVVGNVNSSGLAKTRMAKSVLDAGWRSFRNMLAYKSIANGARYMEVNEAFTTQVCSDCGCISGPKGRQDLSVREWRCGCGSFHDRDHNAALNILRIGQDTLTGAVI